MVTFAGTQADFLEAIAEIITLDFDAIEAYQAAINRIQKEEYKKVLELFKQDHHRHIEQLSAYLTEQGQIPPAGPDLKSFLTQGKVVIASLGSDHAILQAMLSNEKDTNEAYENINNHAEKDISLDSILKEALEDEKRHSAWLQQQID